MTPPRLIEKNVSIQRWSRRGLKFQRFLLVKLRRQGLNKNTQNRTMKMQTVKSLGTHKGFRPNELAKGAPPRVCTLQSRQVTCPRPST